MATKRPAFALLPLFAGLVLTGLLAACGGGVDLPVGQGDPTRPPPVPVPSFSAEIEPVLNNTCALSFCHAGSFPAQGMILRTGEAYAHIVNVPSREVPGLNRITPGDPDNSYLVQKLEGTAAVGARMPLGQPPMPDTFIATLRQWIAAGAPNN